MGDKRSVGGPSFETAALQPPQRLIVNELNRFKHLPHPEERREAARLEGWATNVELVPTLRDASLRDAPQGEVIGAVHNLLF
jgi:hypothetical protein